MTSTYFNSTCPAENTIATDQSSFFDGRWDAHEKGWVIAGATAFIVSSILCRSPLLTRSSCVELMNLSRRLSRS